ncbi:MAG: DNA gyrase subunit A, partial [Microbacterium sp.]
SKKLTGIADVTDLTDRNHGLRLVIGIKTGFDPQAVLEQLYRLTPLEDSFSINNVALVDGQPQTLGLKELLSVYLDHRFQVVTRRSRFRLARREERLHLVQGLLIAILDIDEVIQVIRTSEDGEQARARLRDVFDLSEVQAEYILELRLRRLTKFSRIELESERDALLAEIAALRELLGSEALIRAQVARELEAAADAYGTPRRTMLMNGKPVVPRPTRGAPAPDLQIADAPTVVVLSTTGRAVRVDLAEGQELTAPPRRSKHDAILATAVSTARGELGALTSAGRVVRFSPVDLPSVPPASVQLAAGVPLRDYLGITDKKERVVALVRFDDDTPVALGTRQGVVKRIVPTALATRPEVEAIGLKPGDEVVGAASASDETELVFVTSDAQLLRFAASSVRPQGGPAGGMAGINVSAGAAVIFFGVVSDSDAVAISISGAEGVLPGTDAGRIKASRFDEFPAKGRATGGVRSHAFLKGEDRLSLAWVGPRGALAVGPDGSVRTLPEATAKRDASGQPLDAVIGSIGRTLA